MEVTPGDTKGSPRGSPGACYHQEILLVTVPVLLVFLSLHDVHVIFINDSLKIYSVVFLYF